MYREETRSVATAPLAEGSACACIFVADRADRGAISALRQRGVGLLALRSAGFNHVDVVAADELGMAVARVPAHSPCAVAEHAVARLLTLNRRTHRAFNRVREQNFSIEGLMGFNLNGTVIGVVGTGTIGAAFVRIMLGFGCHVLASDPYPDKQCRALGVEYIAMDDPLAGSDVVSMHRPVMRKPAT